MDLGLQESVALARDILFLVAVLVFLLVAFSLFRKLSKTVKNAGKLVKSLKRLAELMKK
jgi:flagellar biogenesis protein FliO